MPVKEVLIAISPKLNKFIPGWNNLRAANMNKNNPLFHKVYQKVANYKRNEKAVLEQLEAHGCKSVKAATQEDVNESAATVSIKESVVASDSAESDHSEKRGLVMGRPKPASQSDMNPETEQENAE